MEPKNTKVFELRPYTLKELRTLYGVSKYVFTNMIKPFCQELGLNGMQYLNVHQVEIILNRLGMPRKLSLND